MATIIQLLEAVLEQLKTRRKTAKKIAKQVKKDSVAVCGILSLQKLTASIQVRSFYHFSFYNLGDNS
jgi:predicted nucleic acid-binding protein